MFGEFSEGRFARRGSLYVPIRSAPSYSRSRHEYRARRRAALSGRAVPASRGRRFRGGARDRNENVRGSQNQFRQDRPATMMKIFGQDNSELMQINSLEREGGKLIIKGK